MLQQYGISTAQKIALISGVVRERVYPVLHSLQDMGLVNKIVTSPTAFEALPLDETIDILIERKRKALANLRDQAKLVIQEYKPPCETLQSDFVSNFMIVPKNAAYIHRIIDCVENAKKSIDAITTWKRFESCSVFAEKLGEAQMQGVKLRIIVEKPEEEESLIDLLNQLCISISKCKVISFSPDAVFCLYDKQLLTLCTEKRTELTESPAMVTDNPSLIALANSYFRNTWIVAQPLKE